MSGLHPDQLNQHLWDWRMGTFIYKKKKQNKTPFQVILYAAKRESLVYLNKLTKYYSKTGTHKIIMRKYLLSNL